PDIPDTIAYLYDVQANTPKKVDQFVKQQLKQITINLSGFVIHAQIQQNIPIVMIPIISILLINE
ncbi:hypothetical protein AAULH_14581, partial [Lactobacillus helveticus MTCC 5463]